MKSTTQFLGLECGGTKSVATLADADGNVVLSKRGRRNPSARADETVAGLISLGFAVLAEAKQDRETLSAVGFGFGGTVNRNQNRPVLNLHEAGWETLDATQQLQAAFGVPVFCENDCNVAALAEALLGAGSAEGVTFYITVGSGIGGGIVHDGHILECSPFGEAEIGHIVIEENGPLCGCGNRGCLESICSGWGLAAMAERLSTQFTGTSAFAGRLPALPKTEVARELFAAYQEGDLLAQTCVEQFCTAMGKASAIVMNLLSPRAIVFGGGVMCQQWLPQAIKERTQGQVAPYLQQPCRFETARLGEQAVSLGAILYAGQKFMTKHSLQEAL
jgi:glucokinase